MTGTRTLKGIILGLICTTIASAEVKLPAIFGDGMVLQQKETVCIWGWAAPGEKIEVAGSWKKASVRTQADKDGNWSLKLKTVKAGGPYTLTVKGTNEIVLKDILLGEVWVCSGQSNMEYTLKGLNTEAINADIAKADYPQIRLFTVKKAFSPVPLNDVEGGWQVCSPSTVPNFSATAYYFGQKLHNELKVPVGLVASSWGGTKAEAWASKDGLAKFDRFQEAINSLTNTENNAAAQEKFKTLASEWEDKITQLDPGLQQEWFKPQMDDSDWGTMELPSLWAGTDLESVDGIVWFRRNTTLPPSWTRGDMELQLGAIDDVSTVWFNGVKLETTFGWDQKRILRIPASALRVGSNSIVVRVVDGSGEGGFSGQPDDMRIGPPGSDAKTGATVAKTWKYKISYKGSVPGAPDPSNFGGKPNHNTPTTLYNAMIHPIQKMRIAGAIWYQGESNCYDPILYRTLFPALITDWRNQWNQKDLPFYYVQIAPFEYGKQTSSQALREAQMMTLSALPNVGMAVTMDIGEEKDIHPKNKQDVGDRLARWALAKDYGKKDLVFSGPIYKGMKVERNTIRLSFDYANDGLVAKGGPLTDFMIAGEDKKFIPAKAVIEDSTVVVSCSEIKNPVAVRYGWSNWTSPNLFNKSGLPASSFRTDDWPLQ